MVIVDVSIGGLDAQTSCLAQQPPGAALYSLCEPAELSQ